MELRTKCEKCEIPLKPNDAAFLCSYECTYCEPCTKELKNTCQNCQGKLESRQDKIKDLIITRKAVLADLDELNKLFNQYLIFYRKKIRLEKSRQFLMKRMENKESEIFVAEFNKKRLIGFEQLYPTFSSLNLKSSWVLNDLFIYPDFRGLDISKKLIDVAKSLCRETNAAGLFLETEKNNDIANRLYKKEKFGLEDHHNFYYWANHEK